RRWRSSKRASRKCWSLAFPKRRISSRSAWLVGGPSACLSNAWIGRFSATKALCDLRRRAMGELYEEFKNRLTREKGTAMATVVSGEEHVGAKLLVLPGQSAQGSLGDAELERRVIADAERAIWN